MVWTLQSAYETYHLKLDWKRTLDLLLRSIQIHSHPCLLSPNVSSSHPVVQIKILKVIPDFLFVPHLKSPQCYPNIPSNVLGIRLPSAPLGRSRHCFLETWPATTMSRPPFCPHVAAWNKAAKMTWWSLGLIVDGLILLSQPSKLLPNLGQYLFKCSTYSLSCLSCFSNICFLVVPLPCSTCPYLPAFTFATFLLKSSHWLLLPLIRFWPLWHLRKAMSLALLFSLSIYFFLLLLFFFLKYLFHYFPFTSLKKPGMKN